MLRVAGLRTGVEILGSETSWLVPVDPPFAGVLPTAFRQVGTNRYAHPSLWVHELLDSVSGDVLGYLIMAPEDPESVALYAETEQALESLGAPGVNAAYQGLQPGEEHWLWLDVPWPDGFVLRGAEYALAVPEQALTGPRSAYPLDRFVDGPAPPLATERQYRIATTAQGAPVGYLSLDAEETQTWAADPAALYQQLIPPGPKGTWHFESVTNATAPSTYLPLSSVALGRIDLSARGY